MDFHVRMVDGGTLSMVLTRGLAVGAPLRLGAPVGTLTYQPGSRRDVLLVAGSTGLAPLKAIAEQIAGLPDPPRVHLFFGARTADGLYDLAYLEKMAAASPWLTVVPAVSDESAFPGERGMLPDVVARSGNWRGRDVYACGPTPVVEATVDQLTALGVPPEQIHIEDFGWSDQ
jgi:NAD(P)H-flavin reductase